MFLVAGFPSVRLERIALPDSRTIVGNQAGILLKRIIMNPFMFHGPTKILFGEGLAVTVADAVKELGGSKILLVTDAVLLKTGIVNPIVDALRDDGGLEVVIFSDVPSDSDVSAVNQGTALGRSNGCDVVLS